MFRHLLTCYISSKSIHAFLSNLANRQTDGQTDKRGKTHLPPPLSAVNNNNNANVYGAVITARVHPVHLMNVEVERRHEAADP